MKKTFLCLAFVLFFLGNQIYAINQVEQSSDNNLAFLVSEALVSSAKNVKIAEGQNGQEYTLQYIDSRVLLKPIVGGPEFLELCEKTYREHMLLGIQTQNREDLSDQEKKEIIMEGRKKILVLQRHLRAQLEPIIKQIVKQKAREDIDIVYDIYTGSLVYIAEGVSL